MFYRTVIFLFVVVTTVNVTGTLGGKSKISDHQELKIELKLKQLNKPALKSIHSPDGDIIDCVSISNQPAFDHPMLKNHTIQMRPSLYPKDDPIRDEVENTISQLWHTKGECPENTIPIRRIRRDDLLRSDFIENYGRKFPTNISQSIYHPEQDPRAVHEYAAMHFKNGAVRGSKSRISLWGPKTEAKSDMTLAQTWLFSDDVASGINTLESGWQVLSQMYGDKNTRLFTYWTRDAYTKTGCYNLLCPGFVQVSKEIALGAALNPLSTYGGHQYDINLSIAKDPSSGNWWLKLGSKDVGYWPSSIVPKLTEFATGVEWGGEIVTNVEGTNKQQTVTEMGSGHFPAESFGKAAYFMNLEYIDKSNNPVTPLPENLTTIVTRSGCYDLKVGNKNSWGTYFFYGGPGRNPHCP